MSAAARLRVLGRALAAAIGSVSVLGIAYELTDLGLPGALSLDDELTLPAMVAALLLAACAAAAVGLALANVARTASVALALGFAGMSLDELLGVHEHLEWRAGTDWQMLYAPVIVAAALVWALVVRDVRRQGLPYASLVAGAVLWGGSQLLENLQRNDKDERVAAYEFMMVVEETWEMAGSALFLLGLLLVVMLARVPRAGATPADR